MSAESKHIVSYKTFIIVWAVLLFLTAVTVWVAKINLGFLNVVAALTVATTKALIVILFFMHLKYENKLFKISVFITFLVLALFIGFTFFDVAYR
ncbi:MAG: cytochrome C oxidase subunit IV family protein [Deferribacterales bacterium]|jgi:cytochrome c oxidase subunit 4|nr:cytochrome C oxidase subunit IV family protein [Deferribacterales bacterium]MBZ4647077.1 caa(3)-type oxidase, subunit [Clostridia bacterium]